MRLADAIVYYCKFRCTRVCSLLFFIASNEIIYTRRNTHSLASAGYVVSKHKRVKVTLIASAVRYLELAGVTARRRTLPLSRVAVPTGPATGRCGSRVTVELSFQIQPCVYKHRVQTEAVLVHALN